jgi:hypothetical protein|tara:strand:- start:250 stop:528 length:279 start_codon:yes stop_codon:yes gene_type:complete
MNENILHYLLLALATIGTITIPFAINSIRQLANYKIFDEDGSVIYENNWSIKSIIVVFGLAFVLLNCFFVAVVGYATIFDAWHLTISEVTNG